MIVQKTPQLCEQVLHTQQTTSVRDSCAQNVEA